MFFGPITYYGGKPPKGRVAKIIHPQEKLIFATHFHFLTIAKYWIPFAVSALLTLIIPPFLPLSYAVNAAAVLVAITLIATAYGLGSTYLWSREWFVVTNRRVLLIKGIIVRKVPQMPATKVTDMTYERSVAGLIFGYGTFIFESAGQVQALSKITYVPNPDELHHELATVVYDLKGKKISGMKPLPRFGSQFRKIWHWVAGRPAFEDLEETYDPEQHDDLDVTDEPSDPTDPLDPAYGNDVPGNNNSSPANTRSAPQHHTEQLPTTPLGVAVNDPVLTESTPQAGRRPAAPRPDTTAAVDGRQRARAAANQQRTQLRYSDRTRKQPAVPPIDRTSHDSSVRSNATTQRRQQASTAAHTEQIPRPISNRRPTQQVAAPLAAKPTERQQKNALARKQASKLLEEWDDD